MKTRKVTIDYSREGLGVQEIEAQVLHHLHDVDGSQIILLKTARRESVENFIYNEVVDTETFNTKEK
jgi:hypothetical protein